MKKNNTILTGYAMLMLAYQAWRVYDYMSGSLQGVSAATSLLVSAAFIAFSEMGLLVWLHIGTESASTQQQESTAGLLVWVDFVGSMILGLADLAKHNTVYAVDLSAIDPILFLSPWLLVLCNIAGYIYYSQHDSATLLQAAERRMEHEETELHLAAKRQAIRQLMLDKDAIGKELSPHYYRDIRNRVTGSTIKRFNKHDVPVTDAIPTPPQPEQQLEEVHPLALRRNGHRQGQPEKGDTV